MDYRGHVLPELVSGTLVKRYKRFLADVKLGAHSHFSGFKKFIF